VVRELRTLKSIGSGFGGGGEGVPSVIGPGISTSHLMATSWAFRQENETLTRRSGMALDNVFMGRLAGFLPGGWGVRRVAL
jgi:hypothetical protein